MICDYRSFAPSSRQYCILHRFLRKFIRRRYKSSLSLIFHIFHSIPFLSSLSFQFSIFFPAKSFAWSFCFYFFCFAKYIFCFARGGGGGSFLQYLQLLTVFLKSHFEPLSFPSCDRPDPSNSLFLKFNFSGKKKSRFLASDILMVSNGQSLDFLYFLLFLLLLLFCYNKQIDNIKHKMYAALWHNHNQKNKYLLCQHLTRCLKVTLFLLRSWQAKGLFSDGLVFSKVGRKSVVAHSVLMLLFYFASGGPALLCQHHGSTLPKAKKDCACT